MAEGKRVRDNVVGSGGAMEYADTQGIQWERLTGWSSRETGDLNYLPMEILVASKKPKFYLYDL